MNAAQSRRLRLERLEATGDLMALHRERGIATAHCGVRYQRDVDAAIRRVERELGAEHPAEALARELS